MASVTERSRGKARLDYEDIRSGMSLMQTVYTVAMVFGLEKVLEASYVLFTAPAAGGGATGLRMHLTLVLFSILLLSIRFFWVPRNLNSFIITFYDRMADAVFTRTTTLHFPIALAHAVLFYYVCQVFVNMTASSSVDSVQMTTDISRFVLLSAALLLLNSLWLLTITPRASGAPGRIWARNNIAHVVALLVAFAACRTLALSNSALLVAASLIYISNSVIDLGKASKYYILYEDTVSDPAIHERNSSVADPSLPS